MDKALKKYLIVLAISFLVAILGSIPKIFKFESAEMILRISFYLFLVLLIYSLIGLGINLSRNSNKK